MTDKQIIIDDQKKTIHRLQQECTEKTNTILALGDKLKCKEQECEELKKVNEEKNELLAKLGCPTIATARRRVFCLQEQLDQLKQTLIEIKEIAKPYNDMSGNCVIVNCFEDMYKILQEIRKVMPDENQKANTRTNR